MEVIEEFINDALKVELIGMNSKDMIRYVKCTADSLAVSLGYNGIFNEVNPFDWMVLITLQNKTNFFENTVSEYSKVKTNTFIFKTDEPF